MPELITQRTLAKLDPKEKPYFVRDEKVQGFGIKVNPSGNASYIVEARVKGGRAVRKTIGSIDVWSLDDARTEAREMLLKLSKGRDIAKEVPVEETAPDSLGNTLETYLRNKRHDLGERTARDYRNTIHNCFRDWLARPIDRISRQDIQEAYNSIRDTKSEAYAQKIVSGVTMKT